MKTLRSTLTTTAIPLLLASLPVSAGELPFNSPQTAQAQESAQPTATLHWSASIGTGHAASRDAASSSHGVPANPDWTARIGTGTAASSTVTENKQTAPSGSKSAVADAHWTSRIGTGHAADSNSQERT
jgi:hypothetical protein